MANRIDFPNTNLYSEQSEWPGTVLLAYRHPKPEDLAKDFFNLLNSQNTSEDSQFEADLANRDINLNCDWAEDWDDGTEESTQDSKLEGNKDRDRDIEKKMVEFISIVEPFQSSAMEPHDPKYDQETALAKFEELLANLSLFSLEPNDL